MSAQQERTVVYAAPTPEERKLTVLREAIQRDGATPSGALDLLAAVIADGTWRAPGFRELRQFIEGRPAAGGLGMDEASFKTLVSMKHPRESQHAATRERMEAMRQRVREMLFDETPPGRAPGRPRLGDENLRVTKIKPETDSAEYAVARLKRDDPALAERVRSGQVTPNAAARQKGWRKPRIVLAKPETVAAALIEHMPREALEHITERLSRYLKGES